MRFVKNAIKLFFARLGMEVVNQKAHKEQQLCQREIYHERNELLSVVNRLNYMVTRANYTTAKFHPLDFLKFSCSFSDLTKSKSQLFQDVFVLYALNGQRDGFFVEFGATNGISLSNTFLLENEFGWKGILCEPGKVWKDSLSANRHCTIDNRCVWSKTGVNLLFNETTLPELSTIDSLTDIDFHSDKRTGGNYYEVETISLNDLLVYYNAPSKIDYLSVDTEGSEYDILKGFDFKKIEIKVLTVEHNFSPMREKIFSLLSQAGFKRVLSEISLFDDWYVREELYYNSSFYEVSD